MRLDQARIAIRERSWLDNLDLALHVIRAHFAAVLAATAVGVVPMIVVNCVVLDFLYGSPLADDADAALVAAVFLVMIEAPLATAPLTLYLGQALFVDKPSPRLIARSFVECLPQLFLFQVLLRTVLILPVITWIVPYALWPYLNEVILLERNPLVSRGGQLSTTKRNALLHRVSSGEFIIRAIGSALLAVALITALSVTRDLVLNWLFGFQSSWLDDLIGTQVVLWIVAAYFTVARFLMYLDQRIRGEGWEVELFLRAQRERLTRHAV